MVRQEALITFFMSHNTSWQSSKIVKRTLFTLYMREQDQQSNYDYNNLTMQQQQVNTTHHTFLDALCEDQVFVMKVHHQSEEDSWIRHFEQGQMFQGPYGRQNQVSLVLEGINAKYTSEMEYPPQVAFPAQRGRSRSLFHNHQKNLVSLLKRLINLERKELNKLPYGIEAFYLWKWFLDEGLKCKKALFIVFGTKVLKNQQFLKEVALENPNLQKWLSKLQVGSLEEIQRLLRQIVHRKVQALDRKAVQDMSKVKDFQTFYSYFLIFVEELSEGPLPLRMQKDQKTKHMAHE